MRSVYSCLRSTTFHLLFFLSGIASRGLRRDAVVLTLSRKVQASGDRLSGQTVIQNQPRASLKSRLSFSTNTSHTLQADRRFEESLAEKKSACQQLQSDCKVTYKIQTVPCATKLPRKQWIALSHLRTGVRCFGACNEEVGTQGHGHIWMWYIRKRGPQPRPSPRTEEADLIHLDQNLPSSITVTDMFCYWKNDFRYHSANEYARILGYHKSNVLLIFHAFTGCDTLSSFSWEAWLSYPEATHYSSALPSHISDIWCQKTPWEALRQTKMRLCSMHEKRTTNHLCYIVLLGQSIIANS